MARPIQIVIALALVLGMAAFNAGRAAAQSEPTLKITHDEARDAMIIHASIDIAAPPKAVYAVVTDCNRAPKYVPNMESCRIVERDPAGKWQVRSTVHNVFMLPRINSLSRLEFEPGKRMLFKRAGGDMRIAEGEWRLEPLDKGRATRLHYQATLALNFSVPRFLVENIANRDVPALLQNIEREVLEDEEKAQ